MIRNLALLTLTTLCLASFEAGAASSCRVGLDGSGALSRELDDLVSFFIDLSREPESTEKALNLHVFKEKYDALTELAGSELKDRFEQLVAERQGGVIEETVKEEKEVGESSSALRDSLLRWTRVEAHAALPEMRAFGFINDTVIWAHGKQRWYVYDTKSRELMTDEALAPEELTQVPLFVPAPDGKSVLILRAKSIETYDLDQRRITNSLQVGSQSLKPYSSGAITPDARYLAMTGAEYQGLRVMDLVDRTIVTDFTEKRKVSRIAVSPDSRYVFAYDPKVMPSAVLYDLQERQSVPMPSETKKLSFVVSDAVFSADSKYLILASGWSQSLTVIDLRRGGSERLVLPWMPGGLRRVGDRVLALRGENGASRSLLISESVAALVDLSSKTVDEISFEKQMPIAELAPLLGSAEWRLSRDGSELLLLLREGKSLGTNLLTWSLKTGEGLRHDLAAPVETKSVRMGADGKALFGRSGNQLVEIR